MRRVSRRAASRGRAARREAPRAGSRLQSERSLTHGVVVDREALEHGLVRRLLDHIEHGTTDLAEASARGTGRHLHVTRALRRRGGGPLPGPPARALPVGRAAPAGQLPHRRPVRHAGPPHPRHRRAGPGDGQRLPPPWGRVVDGAGERPPIHVPVPRVDLRPRGHGSSACPSPSAFDGMCREEKGLVELPVAEGYGLVVGRLRPGPAVDIDEYLGPGLADELAMLDFADWEPLRRPPRARRSAPTGRSRSTPTARTTTSTICTATTLAGYAYGGVLTFDAFGPHLRNCSAIRSIDDAPRRARGRSGATWREHFSYQYALFPNTSLTFDAGTSSCGRSCPSTWTARR